MIRALDINWYLVTSATEKRIPSLVAAYSPDEIKKKIPLFEKNHNISQITWNQLSKMFGSAIPVTVGKNDYVTGILNFNTNGKRFSVVVA